MSSRSPRWILPAILALAVALRLIAWRAALLMTNDGCDFLWQAGRLLAGDLRGALSHPYHPLYAAATAALSWCCGGVLHAALAVSILSALAVVLAVRAMAARAFPKLRAAPDAAALLAALHGRLMITTSDIQSDGLFVALAALACATLLAAADRGGCRRRLALAGLLTGLSYLARPEGLFLIGVAGLWWVLALWQPRAAHAAASATGAAPARRMPAARATSGLLLFLAGTALCVLPYVVELHALTGRWGLSLKPSLAAAGLGAPGADFALPADSPLASPHVFRAPPGAVTKMPEGLRAPSDAPHAAATHGAPAPATASPSAGQPAPTTSPGSSTAPIGAGTRDIEEARVATGTARTDADSTTRGAGETSVEPALDDEGEGAAAGAAPTGLPAALGHAAAVLFIALRADTALLALVGWVLLRRGRPGLAIFALLVVGAWLAALGVHQWLSRGLAARHALFAVVLLLPLAGAGLAALWAQAAAWSTAAAASGAALSSAALSGAARGRPGAARRAAGFALRGLLVLALLGQAAAGVRPRHAGAAPLLDALAWAREHTAPDERLAVQRRKDGFYAQRPVLIVDLPCFDADLVAQLRRERVALLVLDEARVQRAAPHWLSGGRFAERARFGSGADTVLVLQLVPD